MSIKYNFVYRIKSNNGLINLSHAIINQAIIDRDTSFFTSDLFKLISQSIDIDTNRLKVKICKTPKWLQNLENRMILEGY